MTPRDAVNLLAASLPLDDADLRQAVELLAATVTYAEESRNLDALATATNPNLPGTSAYLRWTQGTVLRMADARLTRERARERMEALT